MRRHSTQLDELLCSLGGVRSYLRLVGLVACQHGGDLRTPEHVHAGHALHRDQVADAKRTAAGELVVQPAVERQILRAVTLAALPFTPQRGLDQAQLGDEDHQQRQVVAGVLVPLANTRALKDLPPPSPLGAQRPQRVGDLLALGRQPPSVRFAGPGLKVEPFAVDDCDLQRARRAVYQRQCEQHPPGQIVLAAVARAGDEEVVGLAHQRGVRKIGSICTRAPPAQRQQVAVAG